MTTLLKTNREEAAKYVAESKNGMILMGSIGVGKTHMIRTPRMVSANQLCMDYKVHGIEAISAAINNQIAYQGGKVIIDDIGTEEDVRHFGNQIDPVAYVIQRLYDVNQVADKPIQLIVTTNLNEQELKDRYGVRVVDRLWEMCDRIVVEGPNLRKQPIY